MNIKIICILLPLLGAVYGAFWGAYFSSKKKSAATLTALRVSGYTLATAIICLLIYVFIF